MEELKTRIALLEQTDQHIKLALEEINKTLKNNHEDNKILLKEINEKVVGLELYRQMNEKKIEYIQNKVESASSDIQSIKDIKNKIVGWSMGLSLGGTSLGVYLAKALGIIH